MIPTMKWHKIKNNNMPEKFKAMKLNPNETKDKIYIFRVALQFGMIEIKDWNGKFYFENYKKH